MMLYRSLVLGLIGTLVMLEAARSAPALHVSAPPGAAATAAAAAALPTIVDVSRRALDGDVGIDLGAVVGLHPGERVASVDDRPVGDGTSAVTAALRDAGPGQFLDLDVRRPGGGRRVLLLVH
jgi:hypothetical protein